MNLNDDASVKSVEYLRKTIRVGSIKTPLNYTKKQEAVRAHEVHSFKKDRADQVREWKASKILGQHAPTWNNQMKPTEQVLFRPTFIHYDRDRSHGFEFNHRAEVMPKPLPPPEKKVTKFTLSTKGTQSQEELQHSGHKYHHDDLLHTRITNGYLTRNTEMHTNPKLLEKPKWGETAPNIDYNFVAERLDVKTAKSMDNTRLWSADMVKKNPKMTTKRYQTPSEQVHEITKEIRAKKLSGQFSLKEHHSFGSHPEPPEEKIIFGNRYAIEASRYTHKNFHSGVWALNKKEGKYMWSDTGSFNFHDRGDIHLRVKLDAPNFEGPTLPPESATYRRKRINLIE